MEGGEGAALELEPPPQLYLIIYAISKKTNVKNLLTSAAAFGARPIIGKCMGTSCIAEPRPDLDCYELPPVRQPAFQEETHMAPCLRGGRLEVDRFETLEECCASLKARGVAICGVEISDGALNVEDEPFSGPTALLMGNEVSWLHAAQA
jgi:hypothetical protein